MNTFDSIKRGQDYERVGKILKCLIALNRKQHQIKIRIIDNDYITKYPFHSLGQDFEKLEWYSKVEYKLNNYKLRLNKAL